MDGVRERAREREAYSDTSMSLAQVIFKAFPLWKSGSFLPLNRSQQSDLTTTSMCSVSNT